MRPRRVSQFSARFGRTKTGGSGSKTSAGDRLAGPVTPAGPSLDRGSGPTGPPKPGVSPADPGSHADAYNTPTVARRPPTRALDAPTIARRPTRAPHAPTDKRRRTTFHPVRRSYPCRVPHGTPHRPCEPQYPRYRPFTARVPGPFDPRVPASEQTRAWSLPGVRRQPVTSRATRDRARRFPSPTSRATPPLSTLLASAIPSTI